MREKQIAAIILMMLGACSGGSGASNQGRNASGASETVLINRKDWGKLHPFYVFDCSANSDIEAGHFSFTRTYGPDGKLSNVHAIWQTPMTATIPPRIQAVFNSENGRDFDLAGGFVLLQWEF